MTDEIIKSGEEIVNEFFEQVLKDENLDRTTREALSELFKTGNFSKVAIEKRLESIREAAVKEDGESEKD
jgi:DNA-binding phage protein